MMIIEKTITPPILASIIAFSALVVVLFASIVQPTNAQTSKVEQESAAKAVEIFQPEPKQAETSTKPTQAAATDQDLATIRSILFSQGDIDAISGAQSAYEKQRSGATGLNEDDFLKKLESLSTKKIDQDPSSFTYPQFFLSSILYHSPDDWVIWINGEKITKSSKNNQYNLQVLEINKEKVTLEWKPERMDKITDIGETGQNSLIKVDSINNKVTFTLKGHQTFTTYAMRIVEGKVAPATINLRTNSLEPQNTTAQ